jgi:hypothetical protein
MNTLTDGFRTKERTTPRPAPVNPNARWIGPSPSRGVTGTKSPQRPAVKTITAEDQMFSAVCAVIDRGWLSDTRQWYTAVQKYRHYYPDGKFPVAEATKIVQLEGQIRKLKSELPDTKHDIDRWRKLEEKICDLHEAANQGFAPVREFMRTLWGRPCTD